MLENLTANAKFDVVEVLRFPLIILVLYIHVLPPQILPFEPAWDMENVFTLISGLISHHVGQIAVPCFFLFSGYFFFINIKAFNASLYVEQLKKRSRTLLMPYLLWNIFFVLVVLLKNFIFGQVGLSKDDMYNDLLIGSTYDIIWGVPFLFPFWYIRDLLCMIILSPLFYLLFKYTKSLGLLLLIIAYIMVWELGVPGLSTTAFMFFGLGAFLGIGKYNMMALGAKYKVAKIIISVLLLSIAIYLNATIYYEYLIRGFIIFGVVVMLCLGHVLAETDHLKSQLIKLSPSVFFIYAIHEIYIINWLKGGFSKSLLSDTGLGKLIGYFSIPLICLLICLCLFRLIKRYFPGVLAVFVGGRFIVKTTKN